MSSYAVYLIPVAYAPAMNRIMNDYNQDQGDNIAQPASVTGNDPATHKFGGMYVDDTWLGVFQNFGTTPYVPAGGYPLFEGAELETSEADALAAQAQLTLFVTTDPNDQGQLPGLAFAAMQSATGLQKIEPPL